MSILWILLAIVVPFFNSIDMICIYIYIQMISIDEYKDHNYKYHHNDLFTTEAI